VGVTRYKADVGRYGGLPLYAKSGWKDRRDNQHADGP
jgi:hypothetical protein